MYIDESGLNEAIAKIRFAKTNLDSAKSELSSITIPEDFGNHFISATLKAIGYSIADLNSIKGWIDSRIEAFRQAENRNKQVVSDMDEFFAQFGSIDYGIDQGVLSGYYKYDENGNLIVTNDFIRLKENIMKRYGMSEKDATTLLVCIDADDGVGACIYAAIANNIIDAFKDSPKEFEQNFGFSMFRVTDEGDVVLNGEELLIDLYIYANSQNFSVQKSWGAVEELDSTFDINAGGKIVVDQDMIEYDENGRPHFKDQQFISRSPKNR